MKRTEHGEFADLLAATLEIYGSKLSPTALSIWIAAVAEYPLTDLRGALSKYVKTAGTGHFAPKPADLIELLAGNDGRPGPEEAWTTCPHSEQSSAVWTEEAQGAFFAGACDLLEQGDSIGARMAFKEAYQRLVNEAKVARKPVKWVISLGWDVHDRQVKLAEAVSLGRLSLDVAVLKFPQLEYKSSQLMASP